MRKFLLLLLAALMLTGCGSEPANDNKNDKQEDKVMVDIMDDVEITEDCPADIYAHRDGVDYSTAAHLTYHSESTGLDRGVNVLTPVNYDESKKYPVLYMLHGIFGDEYSFTNDTSMYISEVFGNLAADGLSKEMIVVFPDMYAKTNPAQQPGFDAESVKPYDAFIDDLVNDLMPYIEKNYPVLTGRENTAIIGFSMGGRESLFIGLQRPDLFGYVGAISPAPGLTPGQDWAMVHAGQLQEDELTYEGKDYSPALLMVCCGTNDSVVGKFPESYHNIFDSNGVKHIWYEISGADHDARAIRSGLYNFLRYIF